MKNHYLRLLMLAMTLCCVVAVMARPVKSEWKTVKQSDGTTLRVMFCGDEHFHFYQTSDGAKLMRAANGDFHYANTLGFQLSSTGVLAHEAAVRDAEERACVAAQGSVSELRSMALAKRKRALLNSSASSMPANMNPNKVSLSDGKEKRGLVIMVNFSDVKFSSDNPYQDWWDILNKEGYTGYGNCKAIGSVHDYFYDQSNGKFNIKFDLAGPVDLPKASTYYGYNGDEGEDLDMNAGELVAEACKAVDEEIDFSDYDWDGDGWVDQVFVLYAGFSEAVEGAEANLLWPHRYWLRGYQAYAKGLTLDGVIIDSYAIGEEIQGLERSDPLWLAGLGTICHEFSHCLGLADMYDTTYGKGLDMLGKYSLMSDGCYGGDCFIPSGYTSFERYSCGWLEPVELNEPATITGMKALSENGEIYMVRNETNSTTADEYYLIENRQQKGWDLKIPGGGLMVMRVNYDKNKWIRNSVNDDASDPGVIYFPANNRWISGKYVPYPYFSNDSLTDTSSPAATVYNVNTKGKTTMGKPITKMTIDSNGLGSFLFCGGAADPTAITPAVFDKQEGMTAFMGQHVTIYDEAGRKVDEQPSFSGIAHLPKGVYILRSNEGQIKIKR